MARGSMWTRAWWRGCLVGGGLATAAPAVAGEDREAPVEVLTWLESVVLLVSGPAFCAGVVIDDRGTVATAYHCVANGRKPSVQTRAGDRFRGRVLATAPRRDVALVEVPDLAGRVVPRPLRETPARVGEDAWALGHPYGTVAETSRAFRGTLQWSASRGVVSAVGDRYLQVDTPLNPGNSGGPLVDAQGLVLGIASRKLDADNIAFAAPTSAVVALRDDPDKPPLGGTLSAHLTTLATPTVDAAPTVGVALQGSLRDVVVAEAALHVPLSARWTALEHGQASWVAGEAQGYLRLAVGTGRWSTHLDAGGGVLLRQGLGMAIDDDGALDTDWRPATFAPDVAGRIGMAGVGFRVLWVPGEASYTTGLDLDVPGILSVF